MSIKIASYNVNGIRAAMRKGLVEWLQNEAIDILCIQETKAMKEQVETQHFEKLGYRHYWHSAQKKGYSGVAILSKIQFEQFIPGCGLEQYDNEGRILRADFGDTTLLNCYFPSGTSGELRQKFKMNFLSDFQNWVEALKQKRSRLIVVGDYNIAHTEMDIHDPVRNKKNSGFLPEERAWLDQWFATGFLDTFRYLNPQSIAYSWWTYRSNARANNKGWRIDYQSVTNNLTNQLIAARQLPDAKHSDHCPVLLEIDL